MSGLVRTTSAMVARPISAEARPAQKQQVWRLIPVACLGLVAASCMWLACWLKPGEAAQSSWLQGECEVHSGTVRRTPNDPQYYSVRLEAQFYHQHQGLGLSSPADVWANGALAALRPLSLQACPFACVSTPKPCVTTALVPPLPPALCFHQNLVVSSLMTLTAETRSPLRAPRLMQRRTGEVISTAAAAPVLRSCACIQACRACTRTSRLRSVVRSV